MHERGGESDGIHDRAAADDDDERLAIHAAFQQQAHEAIDEREVVFRGLAAGDDLRIEREFEPLRMRVEIGAHLLREMRVRAGDLRVDEDDGAMPPSFAETIERFDEHRIFHGENALRERDGKIPAHGDLLPDRVCLHHPK